METLTRGHLKCLSQDPAIRQMAFLISGQPGWSYFEMTHQIPSPRTTQSRLGYTGPLWKYASLLSPEEAETWGQETHVEDV